MSINDDSVELNNLAVLPEYRHLGIGKELVDYAITYSKIIPGANKIKIGIVEENTILKEWYEKSGMPLKKFFNTSGMLYKQMNLKDKLPEMSEDEQLKLLATDGMLVKRPLVVGEDFVLTGFREKEWEEKIRG